MSQFTQAFIEVPGDGRLRHEERLIKAELEKRGLPVTLYHTKKIQRRQLPLSASTFVAGNIDSMHGAMKQLKIKIPLPNDYPKSLTPFLHRQVWQTTLGRLEQNLFDGDGEPTFAKPAEQLKRFTGRVFASSHDSLGVGSVSRRQRIWCSEVVTWKSEYRVYVIGNEPVSIDLYDGDGACALDRSVIEAALSAYRASGEAPSAYAIDFGVLETGQTALIEANDGFSLGAYKIAAEPYTDLLLTRWSELVSGLSTGAS